MKRRDPGRRKAIRCAVYTRKSTEDGLEQDFNSLDAQREACEAYVLSQRSEGWSLSPERYDDGGISGGTLERPALQRLLGDVAEDKVDIIVVYKVDRLTRSLADFAKLVEALDAAGASFVSVTQSFNTSTSMGRLTLNMLLSFAQFEREVTAERIRDKIAASKKKGMWMGGPVPLGYDLAERSLVVNPAEAETVRRIFRLYLEAGSVVALKADADRAGLRSKRRISRAGRTSGGERFSRGALALILRNPLYIGEIAHKGERHPGRHDAILDADLWREVQERLDAGAASTRSGPAHAAPSPLAGLIFDAEDRPLTPSHASKGHASKGSAKLRYRYYVSHRLIAGAAMDHPGAWRLPAQPVESAVRGGLTALLNKRGTLAAIASAAASAAEQRLLRERLQGLAGHFRTSANGGLRQDLLRVDARVEVGADAIALSLSGAALARMLGGDADDPDKRLAISLPFVIRKRGVETKLVLGGVQAAEPDPALIRLLADARCWMRRLLTGETPSVRALAREAKLDHRHVARALPLAFLAPDIVAAIMGGRQPPNLTIAALKRLDRLPLRWADQRDALGFVDQI
ncbi:recombinase family protein [Pikeienuella sp. HZG-20]|uniref:recombinase family protein n=1 Tax=Paludibacillus litoralis TaxID=3133267 RepID=UPI0030EEE121